MKINGKEIIGNHFAYDGCHKIYVIEDDIDLQDATRKGYEILPISRISEIYKNSCPLKFIDNWKLNKVFVGQYEKAVFDE